MGTMQKAQFAPTQARVTFSSLFGHSFPERCVFTSFSQIQGFKGCMVFADPPMADAALRNAEQVQGNICVIRRGGGSFFDKAKRAAAAGASGIVFVNNANEVFLAECEGVPCNVPSVTIPLGAYERLADLQKCAPIAWFLEVVVSVEMDGSAPPPAVVNAAGTKMRLFVTVVKASGLRAADGDTDLCPFIEIFCGDRCRRTRTHYGGGAELLWNQRLSFNLTSNVTSIAVRCHDEESPPSDAAIVGEDASVSLNHLLQGPVNVPYPVEVLLKNSYGAAAGSVHLQLTLGVITAQQRSSAARRGVIGVIALEAENVPPPATLGEKGSPFLKVKVGAAAKRTPVSTDTHATAVWNHRMRFLMPRVRPGGTPFEDPASSPLKLDLQLWHECRLGHVPIGCEGSLSLSSVRAKGDSWEGWIDMQGSSGEPRKARVKCSVKCLETPHAADSAAVPDKRASSGVRSLLDADLALFYMMFSAFVFAVPPLRSCLIWVVLPSVLTSTCFLFILLLGGLLVKRRVLVPYLIKYFVGAILGTGHYAQPLRRKTNEKGAARDPRPVFVSDVSLLENLSIYDMYNFWCTGKLALSRVAIPQPTGWCLGENLLFLKAENVHIEAAPATLWTRAPIAETITVRQFELNISVKDCLESNIMALASNVDASLCAFSRLFGKVEGGIKCVKFEEGQIRLVASHLGEGGALDTAFNQKEPLVVPVDRMDISDVGCFDRDGSSDELAIGYEAAVKRLTYHLLEAVAEAQRARSSVNMYLSLDPEAIWQGIGDDEDADDDLEEVHSGEETSSQEEAIVEDSGPEHIAY